MKENYPVFDISPEAVLKMAIEEELRLLSCKIDRLYATVDGRLTEHGRQLRFCLKYHDQLLKKTKENIRLKKKLEMERAKNSVKQPINQKRSFFGWIFD